MFATLLFKICLTSLFSPLSHPPPSLQNLKCQKVTYSHYLPKAGERPSLPRG